jgi:type I restriction enzyme S subunit
LASPLGRRAIIEQATSAAGLYTLSLSKVDALPIPLAPLEEQTVLISAVQDAVAHISSLSAVAQSSGADLTTLERAVLAKAFRGELVPQDPNDEPAEAMLARSQAANATATNGSAAPAKDRKTRRDRGAVT